MAAAPFTSGGKMMKRTLLAVVLLISSAACGHGASPNGAASPSHPRWMSCVAVGDVTQCKQVSGPNVFLGPGGKPLDPSQGGN